MIPSSQSSSGEAKLYVGRPSERTRTRSSSSALGTSIRPLIASSQPVAPSSTLNRYFAGARTIYSVHLGGVAEPAQLVAAQYAWNADAPGAAPVAGSQREALAQLEAARSGGLRPAEVFGQAGLLERACERLYGPRAGPHLAEVFAATAPEDRPVAMVWYTITREVGQLRSPQEFAAADRVEYWRSRERATARAAQQVDEALACSDQATATREDLDWLRRCLELGRRLCGGLALAWQALAESRDGAEVAAYWVELAAHIREQFARDRFEPLGGDIAAAEETAELLRAWAEQLR